MKEASLMFAQIHRPWIYLDFDEGLCPLTLKTIFILMEHLGQPTEKGGRDLSSQM